MNRRRYLTKSENVSRKLAKKLCTLIKETSSNQLFSLLQTVVLLKSTSLKQHYYILHLYNITTVLSTIIYNIRMFYLTNIKL